MTMFYFCPNLPLLCQKCETLGREGNPAFHSRLTGCASTKNAKTPAMGTGAFTGHGHDRGLLMPAPFQLYGVYWSRC